MSEESADEASADPLVTSAFERPKTILKLLAIPATVIVVVVSTILLGSTSHANPTGSVAGVVNAATEFVRLSGVNTAHVELAAEISTVNNHWARFEAVPTKAIYASQFAGEYGYTHFARRSGWTVIAAGTTHVGCATESEAATVPLAVIEGFHTSCPSL